MSNQLIVTRHPALVSFLIEMGLADKTTPVIGHATPEAVKGKNVLGVLPLHLAVHANSVTEVPMDIPPEMRGKELTIEQMRQYALTPRTYQVFEQMKKVVQVDYMFTAHKDPKDEASWAVFAEELPRYAKTLRGLRKYARLVAVGQLSLAGKWKVTALLPATKSLFTFDISLPGRYEPVVD